jgi:PEGA domain
MRFAALPPMALVALVGLVAPSALAQSAPAPLSESLAGAAKDAYASARILVNNSDYAGAYAKYDEAYSLSRDPRLLFDMAVCARSLKAYAKMQSLLARYAHEAGSTMSSADRADVANAIAAIRNLVGTVTIDVTEAGATVAVDGVAEGTTPLGHPLVIDLGSHGLTVKKPGFEPVEQTLTIVGGSETSLTFALKVQRRAGQLVVTADEGATIVVDDGPPFQGRFDSALAAGAHDVRVSEPGRSSYRVQVDLHDGETRIVPVTLESEKHPAPIWPWIVGGAAVVAGAAVGGYFLFKSDSSQPGLTGSFATVKFSAFEGR